MKYLLLLLPLILSCTTTPQGKSIDGAQWSDFLITKVALAKGATELNGAYPYIIPVKLSMGYVVEKVYPDDCEIRANITAVANTITWGAVFSNAVVLACGTFNPLFIVVGGATYYIFKDKIEPDVYNCDSGEQQ